MITDTFFQFTKKIKAIQRKQILDLFQQNPTRQQQLQEILNRVNQESFAPSLSSLIYRAGSILTSRSFNFFLERVADDFAALNVQATSLFELLQAQRIAIEETILTQLDLAIAKMEEQVEGIRLLRGSTLGMNKFQFETFKVIPPEQDIFITDPKTGQVINSRASVDTKTESLVSLSNQNISVPILFIKPIVEIDGEFTSQISDGNSPDIVLRTDNRFVAGVIRPQPEQEGITFKYEIIIGPGTYNYINVNFDGELTYRFLTKDLQTEITPFSRAGRSNKIFIPERQGSLVLEVNVKDFFSGIVFREEIQPGLERNSFSFESSRDIFTQERQVLRDIDNLRIRNPITERGFIYMFGLENIDVGISNTANTSVWVSEPMKGSFRELSVTADIVYPSSNNLFGDVEIRSDPDFALSTVEAYILESGQPLIPLFMQNAKNAYHEQIFFNEQGNAKLQFITEDEDLQVFQSGIPIDSTVSQQAEGTFVSIDNPQRLNVYTVSYIPKKTNHRKLPTDLTQVVLLSDKSWMGENFIVHFDKPSKDPRIVFIFRNTTNTYTCSINSYNFQGLESK